MLQCAFLGAFLGAVSSAFWCGSVRMGAYRYARVRIGAYRCVWDSKGAYGRMKDNRLVIFGVYAEKLPFIIILAFAFYSVWVRLIHRVQRHYRTLKIATTRKHFPHFLCNQTIYLQMKFKGAKP